MQPSQLHAWPRWSRENTSGLARRPITLDNEIIERAAKALFDSVFSSCGRLDWTGCDESTKTGFRREATAVINAVWPELKGQGE